MVNYMAEKKYFDRSDAAFSILATNSFYGPVKDIIQGTTALTRIGNKIFIREIQWHLCFIPLVTMPVGGSFVRYGLYHNKDTNGAAITGLQLFQADDAISLRATPYLPKITVSHQGVFSMMPTSSENVASVITVRTVGAPTCIFLSQKCNKIVTYTGNNGTVADLLKDDYGLFVAAKDALACTVTVKCKVIFSDA